MPSLARSEDVEAGREPSWTPLDSHCRPAPGRSPSPPDPWPPQGPPPASFLPASTRPSARRRSRVASGWTRTRHWQRPAAKGASTKEDCSVCLHGSQAASVVPSAPAFACPSTGPTANLESSREGRWCCRGARRCWSAAPPCRCQYLASTSATSKRSPLVECRLLSRGSANSNLKSDSGNWWRPTRVGARDPRSSFSEWSLHD